MTTKSTVDPSSEQQQNRLLQEALKRVQNGLAPSAEIYRLKGRQRIDWSVFPRWAQPVDPEIFDGCCHEG